MKILTVFNGFIEKDKVKFNDKDYISLIENYNIIETYYKVEQLLYILIGNYDDFCVTVNKTTLKNFFEDSIDKEITIDITNVNWKLLNLSASFKCYIDQIFGSLENKGIFEIIDKPLHEELLEKYDYFKKNDSDARYLYCLRNEIQHNSLPMQYVGMERNIIGKEDNKTRIVNMTFNEKLANYDYVKIGSGLQSLFDIHYEIIRKKFYDKYYNAVKNYNEFINEYIDPDEHRLIVLTDDEDPQFEKKYLSKDLTKRIELLVKKNPNKKPNIKGWFPGIINIVDIHDNKRKKK